MERVSDVFGLPVGAGVSQEQKILDWLHDSYFASVAGDAPAFEAWPTHEDYHLHEYSKLPSALYRMH